MQNIIFIAIPDFKPRKSVTIPINQGPTIPPNPPNTRKIPSMVPEFFDGISEIIAADVGKMIEKQNPVSANTPVMDEGPYTPMVMQIIAIIEKSSRLFKCPSLSTNKLPSNLHKCRQETRGNSCVSL